MEKVSFPKSKYSFSNAHMQGDVPNNAQMDKANNVMNKAFSN